MKILIVGASGLIGSEIVSVLSKRHEVIKASKSKSDISVDIENTQSIQDMFKKTGNVDAVIATLGKVSFKPLDQMSNDDFYVGLKSKLMGQVNLACVAWSYLNDKGSITLTSGILNRDPIFMGTNAAMVNGAIDGFVVAAAQDMPRGIRINCVSPTVVTQALGRYESFFLGFKPVDVADVARAYERCVEGLINGQVLVV